MPKTKTVLSKKQKTKTIEKEIGKSLKEPEPKKNPLEDKVKELEGLLEISQTQIKGMSDCLKFFRDNVVIGNENHVSKINEVIGGN